MANNAEAGNQVARDVNDTDVRSGVIVDPIHIWTVISTKKELRIQQHAKTNNFSDHLKHDYKVRTESIEVPVNDQYYTNLSQLRHLGTCELVAIKSFKDQGAIQTEIVCMSRNSFEDLQEKTTQNLWGNATLFNSDENSHWLHSTDSNYNPYMLEFKK